MLGFLVDNLGPSQFNYYLINSINRYNGREDIVLFYNELASPMITPNCARMQLHEAWDFPGTLICNAFHLSQKALRFPAPIKKYFYVWDFEWLRTPFLSYPFGLLNGVYGNSELSLIARTNTHAIELERLWGHPAEKVMENPDLRAFIK